MDLNDKIAAVTGAASGIGRATAIALARAGARAVVLVDMNEAGLKESCKRVEAAGAEAMISVTDVSDLAALGALFRDIESRYGALHVLHNNAAIGEGPPDWPGIDPGRSAAIVDINLRGVVLGTQLALDLMQRSGGGCIVNTASGAAFIPLPPQAVYAATKAGVVHFTRSCEALKDSHNVRVNCVCPGLVETPMVHESGENGIAPWLQPMVEAVNMLSPEDIADIVLDFISDDSRAGDVVSVENTPVGASLNPE